MITVKVGTLSVSPGNKGFGAVKAGENFDCSPVNIPVIVINGSQSGPVLYLGAAVHGNELNGIEVIRRIVTKINPMRLAGAIIAVPVQNPLAFRGKSRNTPLGYEKPNMNRAFPGNQNGELTERMAYILMEKVLSKADYVIDIHTGSDPGPNFLTFIPTPESEQVAKKSEELAKAFGLKMIIKKPPEIKGDIISITASRGIPSMVAEIGEFGRLQEKFVDAGVKSVMNVMKHIGMIEGKPELLEKYVISEKWIKVRVSHGGIFSPKVKLWDKVYEEDSLGSVYNPYSFKETEITAPVNGFVVSLSTPGVVREGDRIAALALPS